MYVPEDENYESFYHRNKFLLVTSFGMLLLGFSLLLIFDWALELNIIFYDEATDERIEKLLEKGVAREKAENEALQRSLDSSQISQIIGIIVAVLGILITVGISLYEIKNNYGKQSKPETFVENDEELEKKEEENNDLDNFGYNQNEVL